MTQHRYQALELQRMDWDTLSLEVAGLRLIFSVDVANIIKGVSVELNNTYTAIKQIDTDPFCAFWVGQRRQSLPGRLCEFDVVPVADSGKFR